MIRPRMGIVFLALPLLAAPTQANSITTYGVIITALGNDIQVQPVDKAEAAAISSGGPIDFAKCSTDNNVGGQDGVMITPNGSGGLVVTPWTNGSTASATPSGSNAGGAATSGGGVNNGLPVPVPSADPAAGGATATVPPIVSPQSPAAATGVSTDPIPVDVPAVPDGPAVAKTPEPASLTLLAMACVGGLRFVKRRRV
jgi:hypothetical protein